MTAPSGSLGLVVVGGSLAGLRAVESARRTGYNGTITLIGAEPHLPYDRPMLSKQFLVEEAEPTWYTTEDELAQLGVTLVLGEAATGLDPTARQVQVGQRTFAYEKLIVATGAAPRKLSHLPALEGVHELRTIGDALALREGIRPGSRVVVVGGGFIGAEIASSAQAVGAAVTIVEGAPVPLVRAVGETVGEALARLHARNGVRLLLGSQVDGFVGRHHVEAVRVSTGEELPADLVVIGVGAAPATEWLRGSGIELHPIDGGIIADGFLRTSDPDVYAAGDVVHWPDGERGTQRLENWTNASDQAAQAAVNAIDPSHAVSYETVAYFWSDWYHHRIQFVGSAIADDVAFVSGGPDEDRFVALYRTGDRIVGAATLNERKKIMKFRRLIAANATWDDAMKLLETTT